MESDSAYNVSVYDADKAQVSSVFLLDAPQKPINSSSSIGTFMIVDCVIRMIGQDGEEKPGIKGTMQGTKVTLPVQSQSVLDAVGTLHQGDVIQFASDSRQEISQISGRMRRRKDGSRHSVTEIPIRPACFWLER